MMDVISSQFIRFTFYQLGLLVVLLGCAALTIAPSNAAAATTITALHSGKCVDIPGGSTADGVQAIQWTCHSGSNQQFELLNTSDGYFNIRAQHSGKCLTVSGDSQSNGAAVLQGSCTAANNNQWRPEVINGGHRLRARHSGLCLNVYGGSTANLARLIQWSCVGGANETFTLNVPQAPQPPVVEPPLTGAYASLMLRHSGKCINVPGSSTANGVAVVQSTCSGQSHERFALEKLADDAYHIVAQHSGKCLNIYGGSRANGAKVIQWPCGTTLNANDSFRLQEINGGHRIIARHSGRCLNLEFGTAANGRNLIQYDCVGADNEIFTIGALGANSGGRWSTPISFPLVPVAAGLMSTGEVLVWSAYGRMGFGGNRGFTMTALYDPDDGSVTERQVSETGHDMFCPGTAQMADGRLIVTGGSSAARTSIYEPLTSTWTRAPDMNIARAYHSSTMLGDGSVMVVGGSWAGGIGDKGAELFRDNRWTRLTGVSTLPMVGADPRGLYRSDNHMWLFPWTGNRVFHAGPSRQMHMISAQGNGSVTNVGARGSDAYAMNGSAVMFEPGKILTTGGAPAYDNGQASTNTNIVDLNANTVTTLPVQSMRRPRAMHHSVVLPNGQVFVVGGQEVSIPFDDGKSVLAPELFDPRTNSFTTLAPMAIPRTYHSVALLMADARVFVGGGGLCGGCETNHPNAEVFTPPYLLDETGALRPRPRITGANSSFAYDTTAVVSTDRPVSEFSMVRVASSTHSVNNDQRRIPLSFSTSNAGDYVLLMPSDPGIAPPGNYMVFAIDADGVPSKAHMTRLTNL